MIFMTSDDLKPQNTKFKDFDFTLLTFDDISPKIYEDGIKLIVDESDTKFDGKDNLNN